MTKFALEPPMTEPDEPMPCAWCGHPASFEDDGHQVWFCSDVCDKLWHHERSESDRADVILDEWEMDHGDSNR